MKLNKENKFSVQISDVLQFNENESYIVSAIMVGDNNRALYFSLQDLKTKQTIYCYPASKCYGALIIKSR